jgi:hypothetical protein
VAPSCVPPQFRQLVAVKVKPASLSALVAFGDGPLGPVRYGLGASAPRMTRTLPQPALGGNGAAAYGRARRQLDARWTAA